jgi:hypothetical protein
MAESIYRVADTLMGRRRSKRSEIKFGLGQAQRFVRPSAHFRKVFFENLGDFPASLDTKAVARFGER